MSASISTSPLGERYHPGMITNIMASKTKSSHQSKRRRTKTSPDDSSPENEDDTNKIVLTAAQEEAFSKFIIPKWRPLTKHDKDIIKINEQAIKAFKKGDRQLFVKIISSTNDLYTRDDAVRLAAEVNWVEEVRSLLIGETSSVYIYPVHPSLLSMAFAELTNGYLLARTEGRRLLKTAVMRAVENDNETIFNILVPIVGIDITDVCGENVIGKAVNLKKDPEIKKKWLNLIIEYMNERTPRLYLEHAIYHCARAQLTGCIPRLIHWLFATNKDPSPMVMVTLTSAIKENQMEVACCIIDGLGKASAPFSKSPMRAAEEAGNMEIILRLCKNGCHSFPLKTYGEHDAQQLHQFLSRNNHPELYPLIIAE